MATPEATGLDLETAEKELDWLAARREVAYRAYVDADVRYKAKTEQVEDMKRQLGQAGR